MILTDSSSVVTVSSIVVIVGGSLIQRVDSSYRGISLIWDGNTEGVVPARMIPVAGRSSLIRRRNIESIVPTRMIPVIGGRSLV